jgi:hypothetical protein
VTVFYEESDLQQKGYLGMAVMTNRQFFKEEHVPPMMHITTKQQRSRVETDIEPPDIVQTTSCLNKFLEEEEKKEERVYVSPLATAIAATGTAKTRGYFT